MALIEVLPFNLFALFLGIVITLGIIGIILGIRKIEGSPFLTLFAGILMFALIATTSKIGLENQIDNATFSYNAQGVVTTATLNHSESTYDFNNNNIWIYMSVSGALFILIGVILQLARW